MKCKKKTKKLGKHTYWREHKIVKIVLCSLKDIQFWQVTGMMVTIETALWALVWHLNACLYIYTRCKSILEYKIQIKDSQSKAQHQFNSVQWCPMVSYCFQCENNYYKNVIKKLLTTQTQSVYWRQLLLVTTITGDNPSKLNAHSKTKDSNQQFLMLIGNVFSWFYLFLYTSNSFSPFNYKVVPTKNFIYSMKSTNQPTRHNLIGNWL